MNYEKPDLKNDDDLKQACETVREKRPDWKAAIVNFLRYVQQADEETRASLEFHKKLWNDNPIMTSKQGNINVDSVIGEEEFRKWFVERLKEPIPSPEGTKERADALTTLSNDVTERFENYESITSKPRLKITRALTTFYPRDFTTVYNLDRQRDIAKLLDISISIRKWDPQGHRNLLQRLKEVLGPAGNDLESVVERMCLPWILYEEFINPKNSDAPNSDEETEPADTEEATITRAPLADIQAAIRQAGHFPAELVAQLDAGLWANERRHFAVLTGLSGAGKTLLARTYGRAVAGGDKSHVCVVPVQPAWYDPSPLLGYVDPLKSDHYEKTESLHFLMQADPAKPYTAVLDEMNLSRPEQYMAPLLSAMETGGDIPLHGEGKAIDGVPARLPYPRNLVLIGTVNMDETTHALSDKVLDRAFTLEFWDIDLNDYPGWDKRNLGDAETEARKVLTDLMEALRPERLHFGWRTVDDVLDFLAVALDESHGMEVAAALDSVIYAKVLPKLRGDERPELRDALTECRNVLSTHELPRCRDRVDELVEDLASTGSVRFWR